jgi:5-methylcytosine-specific restriction enzyme subunit McrC
MNSIELDELGDGKACELTVEAADALRNTEFVKLERLRAGWWLVKPADKVGTFSAGGIDVRIRPKLPISRLFFMMGYALNPQDWRWHTEDTHVAADDDLVTTMAYFFVRQASRALEYGVMRDYRRIDAALPVMRGRLRKVDQLRRRHGQPIPLEVTYDEFTQDIPENQILLAAINRLLELPRIQKDSGRQLRRLRDKLIGVRRLAASDATPGWRPTKRNLHYHKALALSALVLRARSAEMGISEIPITGFMLTMYRIFEDFVCVAISEALRGQHPGDVTVQNELHLDETNLIKLRPDLVWWLSRPQEAISVVDAKYYLDLDNDHLKQMLTYCTVLGVKRGHLVYARRTGKETTHTIQAVRYPDRPARARPRHQPRRVARPDQRDHTDHRR